ncbi:Electron transport complex protein [Sodalis praecaptivus]|uniref:Ion-translocating oxidoreductase complex subunit G n=1 Tax=Sodalis praecaptivus TaxID=1239307 RepID=W0HY50_9GAMM|nr:electron transport complex subunit RsxG [Sodalis praecaptivus]AHF77078.1 Electron transport complex protein [Sodalis praecaptivus]
MLETMRKHGTTLAVFAALATGLTALVNSLTTSTIERQAARQQMQLLDQVLPPNLYNNQLLDECYLVTDPALGSSAPHRLYLARMDGTPVAAAVESTAPDGYSGAIELLIGADFAGNVLGARVTRHHETPGLGDKIELRISDWITHFSGKTVRSDNDKSWAVKKDGGMFDQFTGATITPRAVVNGVKRTAGFLKKNLNALEQMPHCGETPHE